MQQLARLFMLTAVIAMSGCVFVETSMFRAPAVGGPCSARIFHVPPPSGEYEEIGFVKVSGGAAANVDTARMELQRQACALGADAVYMAVPTYPMCTFNTLQIMDMDGVLLKRTTAVPAAANALEAPPPMTN